MAASIVLVKQQTYRGVLEEWTSRYHFDGGAPSDQAAWLVLDNAIRAAEKLIYVSGVVAIIRTLGYTADDTPAVYERTFTTAATGSWSGCDTPGDCAGWIRYSTARRDSRGHPVYLRNYYHGMRTPSAGPPDNIVSGQRTALDTYGAAWVTGFSDGSVTHKRTGPDSLGATGHDISPFVSRRKLKRRG